MVVFDNLLRFDLPLIVILCQVYKDNLATLIANDHIFSPQGMHMDASNRVVLKLSAVLVEFTPQFSSFSVVGPETT